VQAAEERRGLESPVPRAADLLRSESRPGREPAGAMEAWDSCCTSVHGERTNQSKAQADQDGAWDLRIGWSTEHTEGSLVHSAWSMAITVDTAKGPGGVLCPAEDPSCCHTPQATFLSLHPRQWVWRHRYLEDPSSSPLLPAQELTQLTHLWCTEGQEPGLLWICLSVSQPRDLRQPQVTVRC
jgi:hypothetical protein